MLRKEREREREREREKGGGEAMQEENDPCAEYISYLSFLSRIGVKKGSTRGYLA